MKILLYLYRRSKRIVALASFVGIVSGLSNVVLLWLIGKAIVQGNASRGLILSYIGIAVVLPGARILSQVLLAQLSQTIVVDLRLRLCRQIIAAPLRALELTGIPRLLSSLTEDAMAVGQAFTTFPILCTHLTVVFACFIALGYVSWRVLLVTLAFYAVGVLGFRRITKRASDALAIARRHAGAMIGHFRSLTEGVKELKLHQNRRTAFVRDVVQATAAQTRAHNIRGTAYYATAGGWGQFVFFIMIGSLSFVLPLTGWVARDQLVPSLLIILYMIAPVDVLSSNLPTLGKAKVALDAIEKLTASLEQKSVESEATEVNIHSWRQLELVDVTHTYRREGELESFRMGPLNLSFEPGNITFLVGGNGCGKTTLAKLLMGLYAPESGYVALDGKLVTDQSRDEFRQLFSVVFSDFHVFETLLGLDGPQLDAEAARYLGVLRLEKNVRVQDGRLSTTALSQGQRKRLALLTAYLEDRPIYLFDEWAADQDPAFKRVFYEMLLPELKARGKTVFVISHDDAYYGVADRIIKLHDGQIEYDERMEARMGGAARHTLSARHA